MDLSSYVIEVDNTHRNAQNIKRTHEWNQDNIILNSIQHELNKLQ